MAHELHIVTGAYGYSGRYIARRLLEAGHAVRTLTNSPQRENPFRDAVQAEPYHFDEPVRQVEALRGAAVLYNTYWIRFNRAGFSHAQAVENTLRLFDSALAAGVGRVVHVSITNPAEDSPLEYFRGKARLERALVESGVPHTILRPAVLFGGADILINNIVWMLRKLPVFGVFGDGEYRLQPIHVDDLAKLAVRAGAETENRVVDAIGPGTYAFRELVTMLGEAIGKRCLIISVPPNVGYAFAWILGRFVGDVILTREEIDGLMAGLLCTDSSPTGQTTLSTWAREHANTLGKQYASEIARRTDRQAAYSKL